MPRPWISVNLAISADGKINSVDHHPSNWTSPQDHARLLALRLHADALMIGKGTLESDRMTLRIPDQASQPLRCIVSRTGEISPEHPIFHHPGGPIHLLVTGPSSPNPPHPDVAVHRGSLSWFLDLLASDLSVKHIHCEGGGQLVRSLAEIDAIDEFHLTIAGHTIFGGQLSPTATGIPGNFLPKSPEFELQGFEPRVESGECFVTYRRKRA